MIFYFNDTLCITSHKYFASFCLRFVCSSTFNLRFTIDRYDRIYLLYFTHLLTFNSGPHYHVNIQMSRELMRNVICWAIKREIRATVSSVLFAHSAGRVDKFRIAMSFDTVQASPLSRWSNDIKCQVCTNWTFRGTTGCANGRRYAETGGTSASNRYSSDDEPQPPSFLLLSTRGRLLN